ncbi:MAG: hypothetical protein V4616_05685 [Bacteroidota bacterium]
MKHTLLTLAALLISVAMFSQNTPLRPVLYKDSQITISQQQKRCIDEAEGIDHEYMLISITNHSASAVEIGFDVELKYNNQRETSPSAENRATQIIPAGASVSGDCGRGKLRYFHSDHNKWISSTLEDLTVSNLSSNPQN